MLHTYQLNESTIKDKDGIVYTVYGIDAVDKSGKIVNSFKKIFFERSKAMYLINLCNEGKLSIKHLADVIEDELYEDYIRFKKLLRK